MFCHGKKRKKQGYRLCIQVRLIFSLWLIEERDLRGFFTRQACVGMKYNVEWVEWISSACGEWSGASVKRLQGLGTVIGENKCANPH